MQFSRQIALREIDRIGHNKLRESKVLLVGVGAIGSWSALLLGSLGVGKVIIADRDLVDESNLAHQPIYTLEDVGMPKASCAAQRLKKLFPKTKWTALDCDIDKDILAKVNADLILDCTDNMPARHIINEWCVLNKKKWVYSAAVGVSGMVHAFLDGRPCFACAFSTSSGEDTCQTRGILNSLAATIASAQISEAVKALTGKPTDNTIIRINSWSHELEKIKFSRKKDCIVCVQKKFENLNSKDNKYISFCGGGVYQTRTSKQRALGLIRHASKRFAGGFTIGKLVVFNDGRVLIKAKNEKEAKANLHKYLPN